MNKSINHVHKVISLFFFFFLFSVFSHIILAFIVLQVRTQLIYLKIHNYFIIF